MIDKRMESVSTKWRSLNGWKLLSEIIQGVVFVDGVEQEKPAA